MAIVLHVSLDLACALSALGKTKRKRYGPRFGPRLASSINRILTKIIKELQQICGQNCICSSSHDPGAQA